MVPVTFGVTTGGVVSTRNIPSATIVKTAPAPGKNPFETVTVNVPLAVEDGVPHGGETGTPRSRLAGRPNLSSPAAEAGGGGDQRRERHQCGWTAKPSRCA